MIHAGVYAAVTHYLKALSAAGSDSDGKAAVDKIASAWGSARGVNVVVVQKDFDISGWGLAISSDDVPRIGGVIRSQPTEPIAVSRAANGQNLSASRTASGE